MQTQFNEIENKFWVCKKSNDTNITCWNKMTGKKIWLLKNGKTMSGTMRG